MFSILIVFYRTTSVTFHEQSSTVPLVATWWVNRSSLTKFWAYRKPRVLMAESGISMAKLLDLITKYYTFVKSNNGENYI